MTTESLNDRILLCALDDIPRRGARVVKTDHGCIALFRSQEDEVFALEDQCPHKAGPLSQGIVHDTSVTCPLHNWVIDLKTGRARGEDEGQTRVFPVTLEDGNVHIRLAEFSAWMK